MVSTPLLLKVTEVIDRGIVPPALVLSPEVAVTFQAEAVPAGSVPATARLV